MLVTNIFSISHNVSTLPNTNFSFWVTIILSSANAFNLVKAKILLFGKELTSLFTEHITYLQITFEQRTKNVYVMILLENIFKMG